MSKGEFDGSNFSVEILPSQVTHLCQVDKKLSSTMMLSLISITVEEI